MEEDTPEIVYLELARISRRLGRQNILIALIFLIYLLMGTGVYLSMQWFHIEARRNPMHEYQNRQLDISKRSRSILKNYNTMVKKFSPNLIPKSTPQQENPHQALIRFLIKQERNYQDLILNCMRTVSDLSGLVGGVEEWYFYESKKLKALVTNSRKRQKSLRGLIKMMKSKHDSENT